MTPIEKENATKHQNEKPNIRGDRLNILLLTFMYVLQGIPSGLAHAVPLVLQNRKATYADQAEFSFVMYSFSLKILWAPIVDCVYSKKLGRRKTWLIPTQYLIGVFLLLISWNVDEWLGSEDGTRKPQVRLLAVVFFLCIFFASTQDIAVDGWSLTMLQRRNIGHSGTCNSVGWAVGNFLAYVTFIVLDSKEFCNKFRSVPQDHGFVSFANFMFFWAIVFMVSTTLIFLFKKDNSLDAVEDDCECRLGVLESYKQLWQILKIRPILMISFLLLSCRVSLGPLISVVPLKLMDVGVPRDNFALMTVPSLPFQLFLPFVLSKRLTGPRSMRAFLFSLFFKLILGIIFAVFIFLTPYFKYDNIFPTWYYWVLLVLYNFDTLSTYIMSCTTQAFFSRVSDPRFGGIYLTLMNTMSNMGHRWPQSLSLWLVEPLTIKSCIKDELQNTKICRTTFDGYYTETILATLMGIAWIFWGKKQIIKLEKTDPSKWLVEQKPNVIQDKLLLTGANVQ